MERDRVRCILKYYGNIQDMSRLMRRQGTKEKNDDAARMKRLSEMKEDSETIRGCLDTLNGSYKRVIIFKLVYKYSWVKVSMKMRTPESTCRYWMEKAMERLGERFDELENIEDIERRASRAR